MFQSKIGSNIDKRAVREESSTSTFAWLVGGLVDSFGCGTGVGIGFTLITEGICLEFSLKLLGGNQESDLVNKKARL
jgi:hypothetical protein